MLAWSPNICNKMSTKHAFSAPLTCLEKKNSTRYTSESNQLIPFLHKITIFVSPTWNTNFTRCKNYNTQNTKVQDLGALTPMQRLSRKKGKNKRHDLPNLELYILVGTKSWSSPQLVLKHILRANLHYGPWSWTRAL